MSGCRLLLGVLILSSLPAFAEITCTLNDTPSHTLSGLVSDPSGARVSGATVTADCGPFHRETTTDQNGDFSLFLPQGRFQLKIDAPRFAPENRTVEVSASSQLAITLAVAKAQSRIDVTASPAYASTEDSTALKTQIPLIEVPQAISIVNRQLLDDQGAVKLDDALRNVAGVMPGGYYDGWDYYRIRGFDASFTTYVDGLRGGNGVAEEIFALEDVEVLKGPSSALYGQSVLGGLINLRSKTPVPTAFAKVQFTGGSFGFLDPAIDVGTSLNSSHTIYARLTALYRTQNSFTDYAYKHRSYVAPALTWKIASGTSLTLLSRFQHDNGRHGFPLPAEGTVLPNVNGELSIGTYVGELGDANQVQEINNQFGYEFSHRFSEAISFQQRMKLSWYRSKWHHLLYPGFLDEDQRTLYRYPLNWIGDWETYTLDNGVHANFKTGGIQHHLLTGVDFYRDPNFFAGESIDFSDLSLYMPIDMYRPVYGAVPFPAIAPYTQGETLTQFTGIYVQDQLKFLRRLGVTVGGRFDHAINHDTPDPSHVSNAFTPRVGVTYDLLPGATVYTSFSKSFLPQSGRAFDGSENGSFVPPEKGQQWEGGIKTALLGGRLATTLAVYNLSRRNVTTTDPVHPNFYLVTGQQRSRGFELESTLQLKPGWNLTAAYSFIDAEVTEDSDIPVGTPTQNVPRHSFNAWTTYEFRRGWARGLGIGFGGRAYTNQSGDLYDTFKIPGYGLVDASVFYRRNRFSWQLNFNNLGDTRYFIGSYDNLYVKPGEPRVLRSTVSWTF